MRTLTRALGVLWIASLLSVLTLAQNVVTDPQHRFTLQIPQGWRVITTNPDDMKFTMGDAFIHIIKVEPQEAAVKVAQVAIAESGENFLGVTETEKGETTLGGDHAVFVSYTGYDDRDIFMNLHIVATESGWVFFAATPDAGFSSLRPTFKKIKDSFQLTKNIPSAEPAKPQK